MFRNHAWLGLGTVGVLLLLCLGVAHAEEAIPQEKPPTPGYGDSETVGIEEKLGTVLPPGLMFHDETGEVVELTQLIKRPTILTLVYLRCPGICSPLMNELAKTVDEVTELTPGEDYDIITVSFDAREDAEIAATGKKNLLGRMKTKVPPEAWRFLTGDERNIARLTTTVGFHFQKDKEDFKHAGTVMFLSKDAKIVRYLTGLSVLPMDWKLAINDAREGTPRTLMQRIQKICYAYDPEAKAYTLQVNRIVLWVTLAGVLVFAGFLFVKRRRAPSDTDRDAGPDGGAA